MVDMTPLNETDLQRLDALRLERLRFCFKALSSAALYISGLDRTLIISGGIKIEQATLKKILEAAWYICAAQELKVYQCNELIFDALTICKLGGSDQGDRLMATAIQEKDLLQNGTVQADEPTPTSKILRSMSLADIAADLEAQPDDLQSFLEEQNATLIDFEGLILVPENEAAVAYEHYSLVRARQKMEERFARTLNASRAVVKPSKTTDLKETKSKKNYLTWKGEFKVAKSSYKKTLQNALNALFPNAPVEQNQALNDILQQSDLGKAYIDKIARDPFYTDKARAKENLLKAASEFAAELDGNGAET